MRVYAARALYAFAAGAALLASIGVAAPPHRVEPGTPLFHNHVLGAYRFAFLTEPAPETRAMTPEMAALHRVLALVGMPVTGMPGMSGETPDGGPIFATSGLSPMQDLAIHFALLVALVPRVARPGRRALARIAPPPIRAPLWRQAPTPPPPQQALLPSAAA